MFGRPTQLAFLKLHAIIICCSIWIAGEEKKNTTLSSLSLLLPPALGLLKVPQKNTEMVMVLLNPCVLA